jgi:lysophospholipase L1-like esterase
MREWVARLGLLAGGSVVALGLAEAFVRMQWHPEPLPGWAMIANTKGLEVKPGTTALLLYRSNPRGYFDIDLRKPETLVKYEAIGMRRMDQFVGTHPYGLEHRYNAMVFRGTDFPARRPGVRRVVVIGDSFTEGWGVREADAYPNVLASLLEKREPGRWEVLNCGRSRSDFPGLYMNLFKRVLALEPDLVVYGMVLNDPVQTQRARNQRPSAYDWMGQPLAGDGATPRSQLLALIDQRRRAHALGKATTQWYLDLFDAPNYAGWQETKQYIRRMNEQMEERGGRFLVALWPMLVGLEGGYPLTPVHETIAAFCARQGIPFHDLLPALRGQRSLSLWVHPVVDMHPNEIGHRLAAQDLAPVVADAFREDAAHTRAAPPSAQTASR